MSARAAIQAQVNKIRADWRELWYAMADGDTAQYSVIKRMDVREFYGVFTVWKKRVEIKMAALKNGGKK